MKKQKDLFAQIMEILKKYHYDVYSKNFYFKSCARAIVKLVEGDYKKKFNQEEFEKLRKDTLKTFEKEGEI